MQRECAKRCTERQIKRRTKSKAIAKQGLSKRKAIAKQERRAKNAQNGAKQHCTQWLRLTLPFGTDCQQLLLHLGFIQ
jgi:hypothetical protein